MLVKELFGHKDKPGVIGMELEVESLNPIDEFNSGVWLVKPDGSLRNVGSEFYTRNPVPNDHTLTGRIVELTKFLSNKKFKVDHESTRTSFHVHCSVLDHTMLQVWNQVYAYWLLERPLMNICGDSRCGNMFCLRACDAEALVSYSDRIVNSPKFTPAVFNNDDMRYSSQNLKAIHQFGSLEYRGMRGVHDPYLLSDWSSGLSSMTELTKSFANPAEVLDYYDTCGAKEFVRKVLPPQLQKLVLEQENLDKDVSHMFDMTFDSVYNTDWKAHEQSIHDYWNKYRDTPKKKAIQFLDSELVNTAPQAWGITTSGTTTLTNRQQRMILGQPEPSPTTPPDVFFPDFEAIPDDSF